MEAVGGDWRRWRRIGRSSVCALLVGGSPSRHSHVVQSVNFVLLPSLTTRGARPSTHTHACTNLLQGKSVVIQLHFFTTFSHSIRSQTRIFHQICLNHPHTHTHAMWAVRVSGCWTAPDSSHLNTCFTPSVCVCVCVLWVAQKGRTEGTEGGPPPVFTPLLQQIAFFSLCLQERHKATTNSPVFTHWRSACLALVSSTNHPTNKLSCNSLYFNTTQQTITSHDFHVSSHTTHTLTTNCCVTSTAIFSLNFLKLHTCHNCQYVDPTEN